MAGWTTVAASPTEREASLLVGREEVPIKTQGQRAFGQRMLGCRNHVPNDEDSQHGTGADYAAKSRQLGSP